MKADLDQFEYDLRGSGPVTVVFLNGFRMPYTNWDKVYPALAESCQVLVFNRPGVGKSVKATEPQTGATVVSGIQQLITGLNIKPPYILVAHSLGGIFANMYARTFKNEVAGIVFVDAPHPYEIAVQQQVEPPWILRAVNNGVKAIEKLADRYKYSEDEYIEETVSQLERSGEFPEIPIAVVSGTKKMPFVPEEAFNIHLNYQEKLLELSPVSRHYPCHSSGHFPQVTESDKVLEAITDLLTYLPAPPLQNRCAGKVKSSVL